MVLVLFVQFFYHPKYRLAEFSADAWRDPETEVYLFTADVFGMEFKNI